MKLRGEGVQADWLGCEIHIRFMDGTDQWLPPYSKQDVPERDMFEKTYQFSYTVEDKPIEYAKLYPVFRNEDGSYVSGTLLISQEFVGGGRASGRMVAGSGNISSYWPGQDASYKFS